MTLFLPGDDSTDVYRLQRAMRLLDQTDQVPPAREDTEMENVSELNDRHTRTYTAIHAVNDAGKLRGISSNQRGRTYEWRIHPNWTTCMRSDTVDDAGTLP